MNKLEEINEAQDILRKMGFNRNSYNDELRRIKIGEREISNFGKMEWYENSVFGELERKYAKILLEAGQQYINELKNVINKNTGEPLIPIKEIETNEKSNKEFDTILKEINKDEYENYSSKTELMTAYLKDYKRIREMFADFNIEPNKNIYISEEIIKFIDNHNRLLEIEEKYMALEGEIMKFNNATESIRKS